MYKKQEDVIRFLSIFSCATIKQLKTIVKCSDKDIEYLIKNKYVKMKRNILIHKTKIYDERMIVAIDILIQYKYSKIFKGKYPVMITFWNDKDNKIYDIVVTKKVDEQAILKILNKICTADKIIILFQDLEMLEYIHSIGKPLLYCTYFPVKPIQLISNWQQYSKIV